MTTTVERHLDHPEFARTYAEESFIIDVLERLSEWMERQGVSRAELARRLGTSRANVTQMLAGRNVSARTLAAAVHVLGGIPEFGIREAPRVALDAGNVVDLDAERHRRWSSACYRWGPSGNSDLARVTG